MFKRKYIYYYAMCFILSLCFISLSLRATGNIVAFAEEGQQQRPIIVIDPGHGGEDGGAVSPSGLLEKDINLSIAKQLELLFLQGGFDVVMTRTSDNAIYDDSAKNLREKKVSDIHNRTDICNSSDNNILISIHQNKFEESQYKGAQVFYSVNDTESSKLAEHIRLAIKGLLQSTNERECKPATKDIYLLYNAKNPAVLVECGFLSNPDEEKLLSDNNYKSCVAYSIYAGFLEYYYQYY